MAGARRRLGHRRQLRGRLRAILRHAPQLKGGVRIQAFARDLLAQPGMRQQAVGDRLDFRCGG